MQILLIIIEKLLAEALIDYVTEDKKPDAILDSLDDTIKENLAVALEDGELTFDDVYHFLYDYFTNQNPKQEK